jgi:hypothetical protein
MRKRSKPTDRPGSRARVGSVGLVQPSATKSATESEILKGLLEGHSHEEIGRRVGLHRATVWRLSRRPDFAARLVAARREALSEATRKLEALSARAVDALAEIVEDIDPTVRLRAAVQILDRCGLGEVQFARAVADAVGTQIDELTEKLRGASPELFEEMRATIERAARREDGTRLVCVEVDDEGSDE